MKIILITFFCFLPVLCFSKFNLSKEGTHNNLEFGGRITTYYNYRLYDESSALWEENSDKEKNRFVLKDAQFQLKGRVMKIIKYELQFEFANLLDLDDDLGLGIFRDVIMDANIEVDWWFDTKLGIQKVPYSFNSLSKSAESPFLQRPDFQEAMLRRDLGLVLSKSLWKQRIGLYAGMFNGAIGLAKNDNSVDGKFEWVGRMDFAFPSRFRYDQVDFKLSPLPMFIIGGNIRYADKENEENDEYRWAKDSDFEKDTLTAADEDIYTPLAIDGKKLQWGIDFAFQWYGFSTQFEYHQIRGTPNDPENSIFIGDNNDVVSGGNEGFDQFISQNFLAQVNYYIQPIRSAFAVRYDGINPSNLITDNWLHSILYAYNFFIFDQNMVIKIHFRQNLPMQKAKDAGINDPWKEHELRLGLQIQF